MLVFRSRNTPLKRSLLIQQKNGKGRRNEKDI